MGRIVTLIMIIMILGVFMGNLTCTSDSEDGFVVFEDGFVVSIEPVSCTEMKTTLKEFQDKVQTTSLKNSVTGDTMNYLLVGNMDAEEAILFIPGTRAVLPDWPLHLFTNSISSPDLIDKSPKAKNSLCSEYLLIFIDYPGVGGSVLGEDGLIFENIAQDISDVISVVSNNPGINITKLHIFGWSLGTLTALRFAESNLTDIPIGTLFLSGTKPGGGADGNQAKCVTQAFALLETSLSEEDEAILDFTLIRLMFPYDNQAAFNGVSDPCTSIDESTFQPNVKLKPCEAVAGTCSTTPCSSEEMCGRAVDRFLFNREPDSSKWLDGVPKDVYNMERGLVASYNVCNCFPDNQSCSCPSSDPKLNPLNGGVCNCVKSAPNNDQCFSSPSNPKLGCADLTTAESIVAFNGKEDLFIQWLSGEFLVEGYNKIMSGFAELVNYDDTVNMQSGHGLPLQAPAWMQDQIFDHLNPSP